VIEEQLKKKLFAAGILLILALGIFLRTHHFSNWLHFELDQSRDAIVIDLAVSEGASNLPLLGPKAAGSFLRLGPIFYYYNYLSALVFGNTPPGIAAITLIFGILALAAFYFLARRYFDRKITLGLFALFAVSLFMVMYSRFSWNPNPLPFFVILFLYALLRTVDGKEKKKGAWLAVSAFALASATQMHFLAFVALPIVGILYLAIKRPRIKIGYWAAALLLFLFIYSPAILNDIKTGGDNFGKLFSVATKKSSKEDRAFPEKLLKNYFENSLGDFLILSGRENIELPKIEAKSTPATGKFTCDAECQDRLPAGILSVVIFSLGIFLLFKNIYRGRETEKKDFLALMGIFFATSFLVFTPLAFDISPRFLLLIAPLPFIFLGFILEFMLANLKKAGTILAALAVIVLALSNLLAIQKRFQELAAAKDTAFKIGSDKVLKENTRVTLEQQYWITDYIESIYEKNKFPVYVNSDPFYRRSFLYHLEKRTIPRDDFRNNVNQKKVYQSGNYFLIYPTQSNLDKELNDYQNDYQISDKKEFGTLTLFQLAPKAEAINALEQQFGPKGKPQSAFGVPVRYRWEEIFSEDGSEEN
jgi:4-amino-4-deoxy-L-arabinose transferase-like glycosyltransferase